MFDKDFPAAEFQQFVGRTIEQIDDIPDSDEGLFITFTDGSVLEFYFEEDTGSISQAEAPCPEE